MTTKSFGLIYIGELLDRSFIEVFDPKYARRITISREEIEDSMGDEVLSAYNYLRARYQAMDQIARTVDQARYDLGLSPRVWPLGNPDYQPPTFRHITSITVQPDGQA